MSALWVRVNLNDSVIGVSNVNESIAMLFSPGVPTTITGDTTENLVYGSPRLFTSLDEVVNLGITEEYDTTNNVGLYFNLNEFYAQTGSGTKMWVYLIDSTTYPTLTTFFQSTEFVSAVRATRTPTFDNRPRMIGIVQKTNTVAPETGLGADVTTAIPLIGSGLKSLFNESIRVCGVLDSGKIGPFAGLASTTTFNQYALGLHISSTTPDKTASVGQVLGIMSANGLSDSIGVVNRGAVAPEGYLMDASNTKVSDLTVTDFEDLGDKQYIFHRTWIGVPGVVYNDGATMNDETKALSQLEFVRVGNSVCDVCESYFVQLIGTKPAVDIQTGNTTAAWKSSVVNALRADYLNPRINRGDATEIDVTITDQEPSFLATRQINVNVSIVPNASLQRVKIDVAFVVNI